MMDNHEKRVRQACEELHCDPFDKAAQAKIRKVLGATTEIGSTPMPAHDYRRQVRIACDDLYDEPTDLEAQRMLLALLSANGQRRVI